MFPSLRHPDWDAHLAHAEGKIRQGGQALILVNFALQLVWLMIEGDDGGFIAEMEVDDPAHLDHFVIQAVAAELIEAGHPVRVARYDHVVHIRRPKRKKPAPPLATWCAQAPALLH